MTTLSEDCVREDSLKKICYSDYALLLEYAELGYIYDSVTTKFRNIVENLEEELQYCDNQQEYLQGIINDLRDYIKIIERQIARNQRKLRIMKVVSYSSIGMNVVLTLILIVK